ncbi:hypothetical protein WJ542_09515 [Paraburkholderia sp. B3]|uniref:hypothetical protein n=1 Tax=Paraburkholderia sp. B3 TaxID=3134791 RepID=UPI003982D6A7
MFDDTPHGTKCERSNSPDGKFIAERCMFGMEGRAGNDYVGRLYDEKNGRLLAQHTFVAYADDIQVLWTGFGEEEKHYNKSVMFIKGDGGDDQTYIDLPPSSWEKIRAMRPRLPWGR